MASSSARSGALTMLAEAFRQGRRAALSGTGQRLSRQAGHALVNRGREWRALVKGYGGSRTRFARTYTGADTLLLAQTDKLHGTLSGLATKKLMERAYGVFGDARYERLAGVSVAHLYNLRQRRGYERQRQVWTKTRPRWPSASGARRHRTTALATCAWTASIRAIRMASKVSTTSMPWTA